MTDHAGIGERLARIRPAVAALVEASASVKELAVAEDSGRFAMATLLLYDAAFLASKAESLILEALQLGAERNAASVQQQELSP